MTQWKVSREQRVCLDLLAHPIIPKDVINASLSTLAPEIDLDFSPQNIHMARPAMAMENHHFCEDRNIHLQSSICCIFFFEIGNVRILEGVPFPHPIILSEYDDGGVCFLMLI